MGEGPKLVCAGLIGGLMVACVCAIFLKPAPSPAWATVSFRALLREEAQKLSRLGLSAAEEQKALDQRFKALRKALDAAAGGRILLDASAVVSGTLPDVTDAVRHHLKTSPGGQP